MLTQQQGRSQELEMGGAKLLGEGSGDRLRPIGGCTCTFGTPLATALPILTPLDCIYFINDLVII